MAERVLTSPTSRYEILKQIGKSSTFNLYACRTKEGKNCILKIATSVDSNPLLDREAFILDKMTIEAARLEEKYAAIKEDKEQMLNYPFCFPDLVESFISPRQRDRRVNILGFPAVKDISNLVPVRHLATRDGVRVDRKTSAWMMGKFLKILVFVHSQDISIGRVSGNNILIERDEHYRPSAK